MVNETVVAVLGGGCSSATEEIATAINGSLPLVSANIVFITANEVLPFSVHMQHLKNLALLITVTLLTVASQAHFPSPQGARDKAI